MIAYGDIYKLTHKHASFFKTSTAFSSLISFGIDNNNFILIFIFHGMENV